MITTITKLMWEYQKNNNIIQQCMTNTSYLRDQLLINGYDCKAKAVIMTTYDDGVLDICRGHLVIDIGNNMLIDPSYETNFKPNKNYFDNIVALLKAFPKLKEKNECMVLTIKDFIKFKEYENKINNNELLISNKEHYYKQADYVEMKMKILY